MLGCNGPYDDAWKAHPQPTTAGADAIPGRSRMSMNALFRFVIDWMYHVRLLWTYCTTNPQQIEINGI